MNNGIFIESLVDNGPDSGITERMNGVVEEALRRHCGQDSDVFISIIGEEEMHTLNKESRGVDKPTDVLSFPYIDFAGGQDIAQAAATPAMLNPETGRLMLGDIIICLPIAHRQAEEYGHSIEREMCFLAVHGVLHLLGYDHETEGEAGQMFALQDEVLESCGVTR